MKPSLTEPALRAGLALAVTDATAAALARTTTTATLQPAVLFDIVRPFVRVDAAMAAAGVSCRSSAPPALQWRDAPRRLPTTSGSAR